MGSETEGNSTHFIREAHAPPEDPYRTLRKARRIVLSALTLFCLAYYPVVEMALSSAIPLLALFLLGTVAGFLGRRKTLLLYAILGWLIVTATLVRRAATLQYSPELFLFDGALAGYPAWSVWFAEGLRIGANLWSLWLGAKGGRRVRFALDASLRQLASRARKREQQRDS